MNGSTKGCSAAIGTLTQAMRGQKLLADAAIPSAVIKYESKGGIPRGCIYGLSFSCAQQGNVRAILLAKGVRVREWRTES